MSEALKQEKQSFLEKRKEDTLQATQSVALQLSCGIDLQQILSAPLEQKTRIAARLNRLLKRERLKGLNKHWSYDINRHIALKQVQNRLIKLISEQTISAKPTTLNAPT